MKPNFLTLKFSSSLKFLIASWLRPVSSEEYRDGLRVIALCTVTLKAELALMDLSQIGMPSERDLHTTALYLKQIKANTSLRRSARVLAKDKSQWLAYARVMECTEGLPYQTNAFLSNEEAESWLFEGLEIESRVLDDLITIPNNCNSAALRKLVQTEPAAASINKSVDITTQATIESEVLYETDFVQIAMDKQKSILLLRWLRPVESTEYKVGIQKAAYFVVELKAKKVMVDNHLIGVLTIDDQRLVTKVSIKVFSEVKLERMAVISSPDTLQQITFEKLISKIEEKVPFVHTQYFFTESEALEWLILS
ncbi:hypothetical protein [Pontibacter ruber]|uniref:STAS/SEC14 domain-containing protein n=1 Tax=Pontibacter ruber TaxID=1343895 RepID=A0ABW5D3E4_9BACT|nr:hypothetical protein [Pontibacter ruber]